MAKSKSVNICINILSSLSHIELLQYNAKNASFVHLDCEPFMFDPASRDLIDDTEQLSTAIKRMYERNKIPLKTPTSLVVPSFFTRQYTVPEEVLGEDLKTILTSEAERFYVFKKVDATIGYCTIKTGEILFTAYPKPPLDTVKQVFQDLKIPLSVVDCNYTATLRGLVAMGVVNQEIENQMKWGMLIVTDYNVFMTVLEGNQIEKTQEAPLPLQNNEEVALINEIKDDFQQFYSYEVLNRMVIVNNSSKIYSTTLIENLGYQGATDVFDQNEHTLTSRGAQDAPFPCSLEAIGGALVRVIPEVPSIDLTDTEAIEAALDEEQKNKMAILMAVIAVLVYGIQYGIGAVMESITKGESSKGAQVQAEINQSLNSLAIVPVVKMKLFTKTAMQENIKLSNLVVKMAQLLPADAWLTEVKVYPAEDLKTINVTINGNTLSSDPLNNFVNELNKEVGQPPLTVSITPKEEKGKQFFSYSLSNEPKKPGER